MAAEIAWEADGVEVTAKARRRAVKYEMAVTMFEQGIGRLEDLREEFVQESRLTPEDMLSTCHRLQKEHDRLQAKVDTLALTRRLRHQLKKLHSISREMDMVSSK